MLFLAGADHERYGKVKWTRRYLLGHRRILKKGDFTTPPVDPIFQNQNRRFNRRFAPPLKGVITGFAPERGF